jgi:hypothetical protein
MKRILLLLLTLCAAPSLYAEAEVHFTTLDEKWIVVPDAHGIISKSQAGLFIGLDRFTLTVNSRLPGKVKVSRCRIGIAVAEPNGGWRVIRWSGDLQIDRDLAAGDSVKLKQISGIVSLDGIALLKENFLVLEVRSIFETKEVTTYAHSNRNVFASL